MKTHTPEEILNLQEDMEDARQDMIASGLARSSARFVTRELIETHNKDCAAYRHAVQRYNEARAK